MTWLRQEMDLCSSVHSTVCALRGAEFLVILCHSLVLFQIQTACSSKVLVLQTARTLEYSRLHWTTFGLWGKETTHIYNGNVMILFGFQASA